MEIIIIRLSHDSMVDILVSNVSVIRTIRGYVKYTEKYHNGLSANIQKNKWGICIDKAGNRSKFWHNDIGQISRIKGFNGYTTGSILMHYFDKDKSIVWNKCGLISTDGKFVHITLMRSKLESDISLYNINRYLGIENDILMDNAP